MTTLRFGAAFPAPSVHGSGAGTVGEKVVCMPLSGWRCYTRLDRQVGGDTVKTSNFDRLT
jgi:hypothetical protein